MVSLGENSCQVCPQLAFQVDELHAVTVQVAIVVVACCAERSSGKACYDTTREVCGGPLDEAPTSPRSSSGLSAGRQVSTCLLLH